MDLVDVQKLKANLLKKKKRRSQAEGKENQNGRREHKLSAPPWPSQQHCFYDETTLLPINSKSFSPSQESVSQTIVKGSNS